MCINILLHRVFSLPFTPTRFALLLVPFAVCYCNPLCEAGLSYGLLSARLQCVCFTLKQNSANVH